MERDITGPLITTESFLEIIISKSAHTSIVLLVLEKHNTYLTNKSTTSQMASNLYVYSSIHVHKNETYAWESLDVFAGITTEISLYITAVTIVSSPPAI